MVSGMSRSFEKICAPVAGRLEYNTACPRTIFLNVRSNQLHLRQPSASGWHACDLLLDQDVARRDRLRARRVARQAPEVLPCGAPVHVEWCRRRLVRRAREAVALRAMRLVSTASVAEGFVWREHVVSVVLGGL